MRNIKTLLELLLNQYQNNSIYNIQRRGLCMAILKLLYEQIIVEKEYSMLKDYILSHKPKPEFNGYWWPEGQTKPRIEF